MDQSQLSRSLKAIITGAGICGLVIYFVALPVCGDALLADHPEFSAWRWPWQIFLWLTGLPCYAVLVNGWRIASNIGRDKSFSIENARLLKAVAWLAAGDTLFLFAGNIVLLLLGMNHPTALLLSLIICFVGIAITVAAVCLSHLVRKAAELQEQSDLTI